MSRQRFVTWSTYDPDGPNVPEGYSIDFDRTESFGDDGEMYRAPLVRARPTRHLLVRLDVSAMTERELVNLRGDIEHAALSNETHPRVVAEFSFEATRDPAHPPNERR